MLTLEAPELTQVMHPGQFALARDPNTLDPYLRRTVWPLQFQDNLITFTLSAGDPLTMRAQPGSWIDLFAPLGRPIEFKAHMRHVLLVGEDVRTVHLIPLAHAAISQSRQVALAIHAQESLEMFPAHLFSPEIEYHAGGRLGPELITWADVIVASGSTEFYRGLADTARHVRFRLEPGFAHVLLTMPMPCGTGACYACAVETHRGIRLACVDGPSFDLSESEQWRGR